MHSFEFILLLAIPFISNIFEVGEVLHLVFFSGSCQTQAHWGSIAGIRLGTLWAHKVLTSHTELYIVQKFCLTDLFHAIRPSISTAFLNISHKRQVVTDLHTVSLT